MNWLWSEFLKQMITFTGKVVEFIVIYFSELKLVAKLVTIIMQ